MNSKKYLILFAGHRSAVLEHLSRRTDVEIAHCFFHANQIGRHPDCVTLCEVYGVPYSVVASNQDIMRILGGMKRTDIGICCGFEILAEEVFRWPRRGFVNIHPSYLPSYRGAHPLYYMLLSNEREGGVTIHEVTKEVDRGRIYARAKYAITYDDDIASLWRRVDRASVALLRKYLMKIIRNEKRGIANSGGSYFPPVKGRQWIDLKNMSPIQIYNLVRSQGIYGGCLLEVDGQILCVTQAQFRWSASSIGSGARNVTVDGSVVRLPCSGNVELVLAVEESTG